jgi:hypothetical protein
MKHAEVACVVSNKHPLALRREPEMGLVRGALLSGGVRCGRLVPNALELPGDGVAHAIFEVERGHPS